jgi:ribosomal protein L37E
MMAESEVRVCPRCGSPADHNAYCSECGFDLRSQGELPTRSQWAQEREKPSEGTTPPAPAPPPRQEPPASTSTSPDAGAGRPRPSFLRPLPLLILGGALIVAVIVVILIASSGGGGSDQEAVEQRLEAVLAASPYGVGTPKVECPADVEFEKGKLVTCHASAADGTTANVEATVSSTSGEGEFSVENLIPTEAVTSECSKEMAEFTQSLELSNGSCEVECPDLAEANPNGKLSCTFSLEEGGEGTVDISLGPDGKTPGGSWEATEE